MIRKSLLFVLLLCSPALAQFTTVSATVHDPSGLPYANGTVVFTLVIAGTPIFGPPFGFPYSPPTQAIGLDARGTFVQNLGSNVVLTPAGSTWSFHVCSAVPPPPVGTGPICFDVTGVTVSGISQDISGILNAVAPPLTQLPPPSGGGTVANGTPGQFAVYNGANSVAGTTVLTTDGTNLTAPGALAVGGNVSSGGIISAVRITASQTGPTTPAFGVGNSPTANGLCSPGTVPAICSSSTEVMRWTTTAALMPAADFLGWPNSSPDASLSRAAADTVRVGVGSNGTLPAALAIAGVGGDATITAPTAAGGPLVFSSPISVPSVPSVIGPLSFPTNNDCTNPTIQAVPTTPPPTGINFPVGGTLAMCNGGVETMRFNSSGITMGPNRVAFGEGVTSQRMSIGPFTTSTSGNIGAGWLTINNAPTVGTSGGIVAGLNTPCNVAANISIGTSFCSFAPANLVARIWSFDCYIPFNVTTAGSADSTLTVDITRTLNLGASRISFRYNNADTQAVNLLMNLLSGTGTTSTNILSLGASTILDAWVDARGSLNVPSAAASTVSFTLNATGTTLPVGNVLPGAWCKFF